MEMIKSLAVTRLQLTQSDAVMESLGNGQALRNPSAESSRQLQREGAAEGH